MVLSNSAKAARHMASLVNRANCGGGDKKSGTGNGIGRFLTSQPTLIRTPHSVPTKCVVFKICRQQKYGYHAVHSSVFG